MISKNPADVLKNNIFPTRVNCSTIEHPVFDVYEYWYHWVSSTQYLSLYI